MMPCCSHGSNGHKATYRVNGMTCQHCAMRVKTALEALNGVNDVQVCVQTGTVTVQSDAELCQDDVAATVREAGYKLA